MELPGNIRTTNSIEDFYPTPSEYVRDILDREELKGSILEPACGDGSIVKILREYYPFNSIGRFDLYPRDRTIPKRDFLHYSLKWDNVVTNPPYNQFLPFLEHSLDIARRKTILLFPLTYLSGKERFLRVYSKFPPSRVWVYSKRISLQTGEGAKNRIDFCWGVWDRESTISELRWIYKEDNL